MDKYSIDDFSKITGLNKILIRTWENRYNFVIPHRTPTNIRYYDDKMVVKGIKYNLLVEAGFKISYLIKLKNNEIEQLITNAINKKEKANKYSVYVSQILESSVSYNQLLFHNTYEKCVNNIGIIECYQYVLLAALNRIGELWINEKINPAQEHFLSELIKTKIYTEIERIGFKKLPKENWVLFLPSKELHDIGILFAHLLLKMNGHNVVYLGQNLPHNLLSTLKNTINNILFSISSNFSKIDLNEIIEYLSTNFPKSKLHLIINKNLISENHPEKINNITHIDDFINLINK